jgi:hypothetical protein
MLQSLILIDALSSACWEKEKKKERERNGGGGGAFFPQGWTCLAGVLCGIFAAVSCN